MGFFTGGMPQSGRQSEKKAGEEYGTKNRGKRWDENKLVNRYHIAVETGR